MSEIRVDTISEKTTANGVSIDSVTLKDGGATLSDNLLFNASGKGVYLGVTSATASNLLDDYEEGTWTPTIDTNGSALTISYSSVGRYTKIGRMVYCACYLDISSVSGGSGEVLIESLPFTAESSYYLWTGGVANSTFTTLSNETPLFIQVNPGQSTIRLRKGSVSNSAVSASDLKSGISVGMSWHYST